MVRQHPNLTVLMTLITGLTLGLFQSTWFAEPTYSDQAQAIGNRQFVANTPTPTATPKPDNLVVYFVNEDDRAPVVHCTAMLRHHDGLMVFPAQNDDARWLGEDGGASWNLPSGWYSVRLACADGIRSDWVKLRMYRNAPELATCMPPAPVVISISLVRGGALQGMGGLADKSVMYQTSVCTAPVYPPRAATPRPRA
jgi:hypothetical protein